MLVCNISLRAPRSAIPATLVEAVTATDATATGNIVFATLVDDPASVRETVDAYLGEFMVEAASAGDDFTVGLAYVLGVDEAATAADVPGATVGLPTVARSAMVINMFVNSDGTSREANAAGTMVNL